MPRPIKTWATPLTLGSFVLMGGTGVLMFFEQDAGLTTVVHQSGSPADHCPMMALNHRRAMMS